MKSFWQATGLHPYIIVAVGLWVLVPGTANLPLIDRDEPRFARAAVEMRESNSWLVPTFNGQYRFDKPPLIYAMIRASMAVWGENEMGARSAIILCALAAALVLYFFTRELTGARGALLAALAWLTCLQVWIHGRLCLADMPMVLSVLLAQWALWRHLHKNSPPSWKWTLVLYFSLALGFAAKGPVALAVSALTLLIWRFLSPERCVPWRNLRLPFGLILLLVLTAAWGIPVLLATQGKFWDVGIGEHVVRRGFEPFNGRFPLPFYYFLTVWLSLLPWACLIPAVIRYGRRHWDRRVAFLTAWMVGPVLIFSFYATQLPHYILPGLLAFFILLGMWWEDRAQNKESIGRFPGIYLTLGGVLCAALLFFAWRSGDYFPGTRWVLVGLFLVLAGFLLLPLGLFQRQGMWPGLGLLAIGLGSHLFGTTLAPLVPSAALRPFWSQLPKGVALTAYQYHEPSLVFYSGQKWTWRGIPASEEIPSPTTPGVLILQSKERSLFTLKEKLFKGTLSPLHPQVTQTTVMGINPARFSWVELQLVTLGVAPPAETAADAPK